MRNIFVFCHLIWAQIYCLTGVGGAKQKGCGLFVLVLKLNALSPDEIQSPPVPMLTQMPKIYNTPIACLVFAHV